MEGLLPNGVRGTKRITTAVTVAAIIAILVLIASWEWGPLFGDVYRRYIGL